MPFFFRHITLVWILLVGLVGWPVLQSCGSDQGKSSQAGTAAAATNAPAGSQPTLDSTYIIKVMQAQPKFKDHGLAARRFYRDRQFKLGWFKDHQVVTRAQDLLAIIAKARDEGLDPKDYQVIDFKKLYADLEQARADTARRNALEQEIDIDLTGTYLDWASDYYRGIANPQDIKASEWKVKPNKIKLHKALLTFLGERKSTYYNYYEFAPLHPEYDQLKKALAAYRDQEKAGGWATLPTNLVLKPGQASPAVPALRQRLLGGAGSPGGGQPTAPTATPVVAKTGVARAASAAPANPAEVYDTKLATAVKSFQTDAGLKADGVIAGATLKQLNVPISQRIDQLILNMERWRWLPKRFEDDYLLVNIPEYKLHVIEGGKEAFNMRVIVGKTLNATPIFSDKMEFVVLAPYWNVPYSIIDKELRSKLIANPNYLDRLDMEVVKGWGRKATPIDPASIDWAGVTQTNFKYTLRRRPGPKNDLGDVKFIFPNSNDIYLHDTPHNELFSQTQRSFSHGCVRVEEPIKLATYLLRDQPTWSKETIQDTIAGRREKYVTMKEKLPVYLVYFTAWADADGHPHFRDDIYGHDKTLAKDYFN